MFIFEFLFYNIEYWEFVLVGDNKIIYPDTRHV